MNPKTQLILDSPTLALEHMGEARRRPPRTTHARRTETISGCTVKSRQPPTWKKREEEKGKKGGGEEGKEKEME